MRKFIAVGLLVAALSLFLIAAAVAQVPEDAVLSGEQCKMCHPEEYEVWAATAHPLSIEAVKGSDHGSESCLHCMSGDYRWNEELTVETAQYGVTCVACHNPHDTPGDDKPAIADVAATCNDCHNAHLEEGVAEFEAGATARHPTKEMYAGLGAVGVESMPSKHAFGCNTCHLEGHAYVAAQSSCDGCHGGALTIEGVAEQFAPRLAELGEMEGLADNYPASYTNYTMLSNDKSNGVHNFAYSTAILAAINAEVGTAEAAPVEMPVSGGTPLATPAVLIFAGALALLGAGLVYAWDRRSV